jgi:hypothetical protein
MLAGLAVLVVGVVVSVWWPWPDRLTRDKVGRVKVGMSREDLYAIFGPAGDYRTGPVLYPGYPYKDDVVMGPFEGRHYAAWMSDQAYVGVLFGEDGRVREDPLCFFGGQRTAQSPVNNLLWRAKRQWRKWYPEKR